MNYVIENVDQFHLMLIIRIIMIMTLVHGHCIIIYNVSTSMNILDVVSDGKLIFMTMHINSIC